MIYDIVPELTWDDIDDGIYFDQNNITNEYILKLIPEDKGINLDPLVYDRGESFYKLDWYTVPDLDWTYEFKNEYITSQFVMGNTYMLSPRAGITVPECQIIVDTSVESKSSFMITKEGNSTFKIRVNGSRRDYFYLIPLRIVITQKNGKSLLQNFVFMYIIDGEAFAFGEPNEKMLRSVSSDFNLKINKVEGNPKLNSITDIRIYDLNGRLMYSKRNETDNYDINTIPLRNGVYIIEKSDGKNKNTEKIILRR